MSNTWRRITSILFKPKNIWIEIEKEEISILQLFFKYTLIISFVSMIIQLSLRLLTGTQIIGTTLFGDSFLFSVMFHFLIYIYIFVISLIMAAISPMFEGDKEYVRFFKLNVYSSTPLFIGMAFNYFKFGRIPTLILSLYYLVSLYFGLPIMSKCKQQKSRLFFIVSFLLIGILYTVIAFMMLFFFIL